jgi:hypothetical protein
LYLRRAQRTTSSSTMLNARCRVDGQKRP